MKSVFASGLVLLISSVALATPDSSQLGPYLVSYDLNTNMQYENQNIQTFETETATVYQMRLFTDDSNQATIGLSEYKDLTDATLSMHKNLMILENALKGLNVTSVEDKTIDGKNGFVMILVPFAGVTSIPADTKMFSAMYWLDSKECSEGPVYFGKTDVVVSSSYPEDVTQNLLGSLHIEKSQASKTLQSVSPKPDNSQGQANKDVF